MKIGIICEGGGMRCTFTAGVLDSWMRKDFCANEIIGVSAGATTSINYVSGQRKRMLSSYVDYCNDKRYVGFYSWVTTGSFFGMDFIFNDIPEKYSPFDMESFRASSCEYYAGATNIETGKAEFFGKEHIQKGFTILRASCSLPIYSPIIEYGGKKYLDGGLFEPIPFEVGFEHGCDKLLVILTRPRSYRKKPMSALPLINMVYRKYPNFVKSMNRRHEIYNQKLEHLCRLEAEGRVLIVAPDEPLNVGRFGKSRDELVSAFDAGVICGDKAYNTFYKW